MCLFFFFFFFVFLVVFFFYFYYFLPRAELCKRRCSPEKTWDRLAGLAWPGPAHPHPLPLCQVMEATRRPGSQGAAAAQQVPAPPRAPPPRTLPYPTPPHPSVKLSSTLGAGGFKV